MNPTPDSSFGQIDDVSVATNVYIKRHRGWLLFLGTLCVLMVGSVVAIFLTTHVINSLELLILPILVLVGGYNIIRTKAEHLFMQQFAAQNNFSYTAKTYDVPTLGSSYLSGIGSGQFLQDVIAGTYENRPVRLYNFATFIQEGKSRKKVEFTVFELEHSGETLDVLLVSCVHAFGSLFPTFWGKKKLDIAEGDFDKYFTLYVPEGFETETLEILTPDIMQELVAQSAQFSFEFSGNKIFIYNRQLVTKKDQLEAMYSFSETLINQLAPVLATFKNQ